MPATVRAGGLTVNHSERANMHIIDVKPLGHGWTVRTEQIANDLVFRSGRAAEQTALRLADRLAKVGTPSEIRIHLRDGSFGGRFVSAASRPLAEPAPIGRAHVPTSRVLEPA